jgi:hypothetical protein
MAGYTRRAYKGAATATTLTASMSNVATLNVVSGGRGADDTSAQSHDSGAGIYPVFTAKDADEANVVSSTQTTKGDLLLHTGSVHARLGVGSNDFVLVADSAETTGVKWAAVDDTTKIAKSLVDDKGDLVTATADNTPARLAVGTNGYVLEADSGESTGLKWNDRKSIELNAQTGTTYTFVLGDAGKVITATNASPVTVSVPGNSTVPFPIGTQIVVIAGGAGAVTFSPVAGVTLNSKDSDRKINGQYASACCLKTATNTWILFGALTT